MVLGIGATPRFREIEDALDLLKIPVVMPVRRPPPASDMAAAPGAAIEGVRQIARTRLVELTQLYWGWPGLRGKSVTTFRAEGLRFPHGRCLIPAAWVDIAAPRAATAQARLRPRNAAWFCLAGFWRRTPPVGDSFTLLTLASKGELAKFTSRQPIIVDKAHWATWLDETSDPTECLKTDAEYEIDTGPAPAAAVASPRTAREEDDLHAPPN
jgi:putative SOS response-associated peptidase YedK